MVDRRQGGEEFECGSDLAVCGSQPDNRMGAQSTWGVPTIDVGARGHLNTASDIGGWAEGRNLLTAFEAGSSKKLCR